MEFLCISGAISTSISIDAKPLNKLEKNQSQDWKIQTVIVTEQICDLAI